MASRHHLGENPQSFRVQTLMTYRWTSLLQTVTCKNYSSKPFETTSNVPKWFQTHSSNSDILWSWYVHAKQHATPNARHFPAQNLLRLIGMIAKTATSSDTTKQSPQIHICRQHIQMLRPKQLFFISNSDLKVPFCSKSSSENQCSYQTASIQLKTSQFWGKPKP